MKVLKSWIEDYIKADLSSEDLADKLTFSGTLIDEIIPVIANNISDAIFDIEITPNRGDCLSHFGIAREVSALTGNKIVREPILLNMIAETASKSLSIDVEVQNLCPIYYARLIKDIKIAESPKWLRDRLIKCGIRPINNIVDITNFIMLDLGHPLHAFNANKIEGNRIIVRLAKNGEEIVLIDGIKRVLNKRNLIIADAKKPIAIAGVMGGEDSEISNDTTSIVLEAAVFDRKSIRKTSKELGLTSEASYRFERGVDIKGAEYVINKAAKMIQDIAYGKVYSGILKAEKGFRSNQIEIKYEKINQLLGSEIQNIEMDNILKSLGFEIKDNVAIVPSYRNDILIWQDLAEEVGRIYGLNKIPRHKIEKTKEFPKGIWYYKEYIKDILVYAGFSEVFNYPFVSDSDVKQAGIETKSLLELANPIQLENKYMRDSLIPGLMRSIAKNPIFNPIMIFEIGNIFNKTTEKTKLGVICAGKNAEKIINKTALELKKIFEFKIEPKKTSAKELSKYKIKKPTVLYFEIDLTDIHKKSKLKSSDIDLKKYEKILHYRPISKYPSVTRDLAFILGIDIKPEDVENEIYTVSNKVCRVELFDDYVSDKFGIGKKNIAYHIYLQEIDKTMTDKEADVIIKEIIKIVEKKFDAKLRS